jgi:hypothetical protein
VGITNVHKGKRQTLSIKIPSIMNWLLRLDQTPRLILLNLFLGVVGALGTQNFLWLLQFKEKYRSLVIV